MDSYYPSYGASSTGTVERQPLDTAYTGYEDYDLMKESGYGGADLLSMVSNSYGGGLTESMYEPEPVKDKYDIESYLSAYDTGYADVDYEGQDYGWDDSVYQTGGQPW